jgi:hypothetical protein
LSDLLLKKRETFALQIVITEDNDEVDIIEKLMDAVANTVVRYSMNETEIHFYYRGPRHPIGARPLELWTGEYFSMDAGRISEWCDNVNFRIDGVLIVTLEGVVG